jgi:hypothetical protein
MSAVLELSTPAFPSKTAELERFGFKFPPGGSHISRTMMLHELVLVLRAVASSAPASAYVDAILSRNVLNKNTESTRAKSLRHLRELYGLSPELPIFQALRHFHQSDETAGAQLALLCSWTRDPLLRATTAPVMSAPIGTIVSASALAEAVAEIFPSQYSELNQAKIARNARATWTSSGHLRGRTRKIRSFVSARPAAVAYALLLGSVSELGGDALFSSSWCRLLDLTADQAKTCASQAHRHGLLTMRAAGSVVEITFPADLTSTR